MANEQNIILHRWFEGVWKLGHAELIDDVIAPNAIPLVSKIQTAMPSAARKNSRNSINTFAARFRIFTSASEKTVSEGDLVVGYCKLMAPHTGAGFGMESTGKPVLF